MGRNKAQDTRGGKNEQGSALKSLYEESTLCVSESTYPET